MLDTKETFCLNTKITQIKKKKIDIRSWLQKQSNY